MADHAGDASAGGTVDAAAGAACSSLTISEEVASRLVNLVANELDRRGYGRALAVGADAEGDAEAEGELSTWGDSVASYGSILLALLTLATVVRFGMDEYELARRKYLDCEDDGDGENDEAKKKPDFTWSELFWYRLDHHLSQSKWATPTLLLSATGFLVVGGALLLDMNTDNGLAWSAWLAWTYVADPGTHADAEGGSAVRAVSLLVTVGGMLVFAMVVGIVSDALGEKVHDLRKGRSRVIESDHTLMLGWNDKSLAIIQELALANESEEGGVVVVLAENDKGDMEETLDAAVSTRDHPMRLLGTEVVFRSGNPLMENELDKVSASTARSIIALSPDGCDPDEADSRMVRQVLSLKQFESLRGHVVVEMQDIDNRDLINLVASDIAEVIVAHDMIGRLMIQCAREPGLANVLENLMGFDGAEFYFEKWPQLFGKTFLEITCRFDDAVPIGIKALDGKIEINPTNDRVIRQGEEILCLAEDNDTYLPNDGSYSLKCGRVPSGLVPMPAAEKLLFCGWRRDMADMIMQLDEYVSEGSELWLFNDVPVSERLELLRDKGNKEELRSRNLRILNAQGNPIVRRDLKMLRALRYDGEPDGESITLDEFDSVLILADSAAAESGDGSRDEGSLSSDSRSLASLLLIQDIQDKLWARKNGVEGMGSRVNSRASMGSVGNTEEEPNVSNDGGTNGSIVPAEAASAAAKKIKEKLANPGTPALDYCRTPSLSHHRSFPAAPISEILDTRTRSLLRVANCQGYVMSNEIVSGAIAVVSEERSMNAVLGEILSAEGCETYIRDVSHYVNLNSKKDRNMSFWDIALRARQRREVAVGYKPGGLSFAESAELILNPDDKSKPRVWGRDDKVIVFALE